MKLAFAALLIGFAIPAMADIPNPPRPQIDEITITGPDAEELGNSLSDEWQTESAFRGSLTSVKVFYSKTGLTQIVCHKTSGADAVNADCLVQKSLNNKAIQRYTRRIRNG